MKFVAERFGALRRGLKLSQTKFQKILDDIGRRIGLSPSVLLVRRS
jgi:hypothetical protein